MPFCPDRSAGRIEGMTELLYLRDAYLRRFSATVEAVRTGAVNLDRTAFYPTGGRQPSRLCCLVVATRTSATTCSYTGVEDIAPNHCYTTDRTIHQLVDAA